MTIITYAEDAVAEHGVASNHHYFNAIREGWKFSSTVIHYKELAEELDKWTEDKQMVFLLVRYK